MEFRSVKGLEEVGNRAAANVAYLHPDYDVTVNVDLNGETGEIVGSVIITHRPTNTRRHDTLEGVYYLLAASEKSALTTLEYQITTAVGRMQQGVLPTTDAPDEDSQQ